MLLDMVLKIISQLLLLFLLVLPAKAWRNPILDYSKQEEQADLVAIVQVGKVADTGNTKRLNPDSDIEYREIELEMHVQSAFKGEVDEKINARIFRLPTEEEVIADLGEDGIRALLLEKLKKAAVDEDLIFIPVQHRHYLVYLKKSKKAHYVPLFGNQYLDFAFLELSPSFNHNDEKIDDSKD